MKTYENVNGSMETILETEIGKDTVYIRSNITKLKDSNFWRYDEIQYTKDEYIALLSQKNKELDNKINSIANPSIDIETCTLDELKIWQIKLSKNNLGVYLENHPITSTCHGGVEKEYSMTKDKQSLLTQMISMSQMALMNNVSFQPSWNAKSEPCTYDWTLEELQQLAFEMAMVVQPSVSKQQKIEHEILTCATKEEVLAISVEI